MCSIHKFLIYEFIYLKSNKQSAHNYLHKVLTIVKQEVSNINKRL